MLIGREHGPLAFRLILQPLVAALLAFRAGLRDTLTGPSHSMAACQLGSVMVAIGLMTLVFATIENRGASTVLADAYPVSAGYPAPPWPYARILGTFIGLLGIGALLVMQVGS